MKTRSLAISFLCLACGFVGCGKRNLKSGEITQLAFTSDGKKLVVVNEFRYSLAPFIEPKQCHSRLRSYSTKHWKVAADTKELSLLDLRCAPSGGQSWLIGAQHFSRFGGGNPSAGGPIFQTFDPTTLERKEFDVIQQGRDNQHFVVSAVGCAPEKPLCVLYLTRRVAGRSRPQPAFVFGMEAGKKTLELQDYPTGDPAPGDAFVKTLLEFTPDGKHIASFQPSVPYRMQLHAADTGKLANSMKLESAVGAMKFSPDGKLLAGVCLDGTLLILEPDLSKQLFSKQIHNLAFEDYGIFPDAVAFVGNEQLAVLSSSTKIEILDTKEWKSVRTFEGKGRVNCLAGSPDGTLLAAGDGVTGRVPGRVRVFEVKTGKLVAELE